MKKIPLLYGGITRKYPDIEPGKNYRSGAALVDNIIFLSGLDGRSLDSGVIESDTVEEQVVVCCDTITSILKQAGSSLDNCVKLFLMVKDHRDCPGIWKALLEYFQRHAPSLVEDPPAMTVTLVENIDLPHALIAMDGIAVVSSREENCPVRRNPLFRNGVKQVYPAITPGMPFMSESVIVGNLIFISGMAGDNPETGVIGSEVFEDQWRTALEKVNRAMDSAGSSMSNVIKTLHFLTGLGDLLKSGEEGRSHSPASDRLWKTELEYFDRFAPHLMDEPPGSTFLKVSALSSPELKGQTEVMGVLSRYMPGWEVKKYPTYLGGRGFPRHMGEIKKYYANTVKVGNLVFVSGQTPTDLVTARIESDRFEDQMAVTLMNLRTAIEETGSALENIIKTNILLPDPENLKTMREMELAFYQKYAPSLVNEPPASTVIHPLNLASPAMHIEIEAIAFV